MNFLHYEPANISGQRMNRAWYGSIYFEVPGIFKPDGTLDDDANTMNLFDKVAGMSANRQRAADIVMIQRLGRGLQDKVFVDGQIVREDASLFYPRRGAIWPRWSMPSRTASSIMVGAKAMCWVPMMPIANHIRTRRSVGISSHCHLPQ